MMTRTEIQRRLHDMVDHLFEDVPDEWLVRGVYPMLRITMRSTDENAVDDAFTLVVGIDMPDRD